MRLQLLLLTLILSVSTITCRNVIELQGVNFELALTSYKYAAILFYDSSPEGQLLREEWENAAKRIAAPNDMHEESEMAMIDGTDPEIKELIDAYSITVPTIKVFRRGIMAEYRGPVDAAGISAFVVEDSKPSVRVISSLAAMKEQLKKDMQQTVVLGFFSDADMTAEESLDSYSIAPWGQYQAAADALRGHAVFYGMSAAEILQSFKVDAGKLPVVYLLSEDGEGFMPYSGEILEMNLSEWVLRNSAPTMGELSLSQPAGELYATQFFSARKLKFILLMRGSDVKKHKGAKSVIESWRRLSDTFRGSALFAYMVDSAVPDVADYFSVDMASELPLIVAHEPSHDHKYKSSRISDLSNEKELEEFVAGVMTGAISRMLRSEPVQQGRKRGTSKPSLVKHAVGSNVVSIVSQPEKDVLLMVHGPGCKQCQRMRATYDILARAVQADDRIVIARIDGAANDLPASWGVKGFPTLLWFPAKDKGKDSQRSKGKGKSGKSKGKDAAPKARPYWDAGYSLNELVSFVQRSSSFDVKTLRIATSEQLGSLMGDEETLRLEYEELDRWEHRNEGREVYADHWADWALGEVVFDGKRWHIAAVGTLALVTLAALLYAAMVSASRPKTVAVKVSSKTAAPEEKRKKAQ